MRVALLEPSVIAMRGMRNAAELRPQRRHPSWLLSRRNGRSVRRQSARSDDLDRGVGRAYSVRMGLPDSPIVSRNPEVMSGSPVFTGTRVPVQTLLDYLEGGESIDDFLAGFPAVTRAQVVAFLEEGKTLLVAKVS